MIRSTRAHIGKRAGPTLDPVWNPPNWVEYAYYFVIFYSLMSGYLGIELSLIAAGITVALAGFCFIQMGAGAKKVLAPIKLLLACLISYILVQIAIHGTSVMDRDIRTFILWICGMIVVQSLCLRQGFLLRCTVFLFLLALVTVPHLAFTTPDVVDRASVDIPVSGNLTNANGLAGWFGFCVVVFAIYGLETGGMVGRILCWTLATGSLFIVGLTVSRGGLLGTALALTVAFRRLLKRGFVPVLLLIIFTGLLFATGLFDKVVSNFEERATEETGRDLIWPAVLERISTSPFVGVGISQLDTFVEGKPRVPHNSFLFFALTSGVVPLALWVAFWVRSARSSWHLEQSTYSSYRIPLLLYALVAFCFGDITTAPWVLLALSLGAGSGISHRTERPRVTYSRIPRRRIAPTVQHPSKAGTIQQ